VSSIFPGLACSVPRSLTQSDCMVDRAIIANKRGQTAPVMGRRLSQETKLPAVMSGSMIICALTCSTAASRNNTRRDHA
jgi:hypothetical protein